MGQSKSSQFDNEKYISLESFRKNGAGIRTPVWFAESDGVFYIYSLANAAKVRRVRNNPRVRVAPCDIRGRIKGEWVDGTATVLDDRETARAHASLAQKYGWMKRIGDVYSRWRKRERVAMAIRLG